MLIISFLDFRLKQDQLSSSMHRVEAMRGMKNRHLYPNPIASSKKAQVIFIKVMQTWYNRS